MLRVQGHAPHYVARVIVALAAALASNSALAEPAGAPAAPRPFSPAAAPGPQAPPESEPQQKLVAFSLVLSAGPAPIIRPRYPDAYPVFNKPSFDEVQAQAGFDAAAGLRVGPFILGGHAEFAYAGRPAFFARDPLFLAGAGPRVEVFGEVLRFAVQGSVMFLPKQPVFSLDDGVSADVGAQFGALGVRLSVAYYRGTARYPSSATAPVDEAHAVSLVPVTLGVRWEL